MHKAKVLQFQQNATKYLEIHEIFHRTSTVNPSNANMSDKIVFQELTSLSLLACGCCCAAAEVNAPGRGCV